MNKTCYTCKDEKTIESFHKNKKNSDGYAGSCKGCMTNTLRIWRKRNPEKMKKSLAELMIWKTKNPEKVRAAEKKSLREVSDAYIAGRLKIPVSKLRAENPELIIKRREQILKLRNDKSNSHSRK